MPNAPALPPENWTDDQLAQILTIVGETFEGAVAAKAQDEAEFMAKHGHRIACEMDRRSAHHLYDLAQTIKRNCEALAEHEAELQWLVDARKYRTLAVEPGGYGVQPWGIYEPRRTRRMLIAEHGIKAARLLEQEALYRLRTLGAPRSLPGEVITAVRRRAGG